MSAVEAGGYLGWGLTLGALLTCIVFAIWRVSMKSAELAELKVAAEPASSVTPHFNPVFCLSCNATVNFDLVDTRLTDETTHQVLRCQRCQRLTQVTLLPLTHENL